MFHIIFRFLDRLIKKLRDDHVEAFSAQATLFIIISFFPFIMMLLSIVQFFPVEEDTLQQFLSNILPSTVNSLIFSVITEVYDKATGTIVSITAITTLWSAAKGFLAIQKGLNSIYEIKETRNGLFVRAVSALYTFIFAMMIIITMILFVFGNRLYDWIELKIPKLMDTALVVISLRTILGFITLLIFFLLIYIIIPNRKSSLMKELPGALLTAFGWMGFSYAFSYYIDHYSKFASMYGSLTAIVFFLLWLYFCMYILFIGAEINMFLQTPRHKSLPNK
ncbi:MAG: YihY/virulence factor BrkB family protein [Mobilitalea sp.]